MHYRFATVDDAARLAPLNHALIRDEGHRNPMNVPELAERMAGWLAGEYRAVTFEDDGDLVGYVLYRHEVEHVYLRQFYVIQKRRRRGVGRAAMTWLREHAWDPGRRVRLDVLVGNAAGLAFWRDVGFRDYCLTLELDPSAQSI
jgi:GNAT superfamily N-acetyltransferase